MTIFPADAGGGAVCACKVEAKLPHTIQRGGSFCLIPFR